MNWFRFGNPESLIIMLVILPAIIGLLLYGLRMKRKAMLLFQQNRHSTFVKRQKLQVVLLTLSVIFVSFAITSPQWGAKSGTVVERLDVILALDISTSMLATDDNAVNRLDTAKGLMLSLMRQLEGDRVGLLYFAEASVVYPLTDDVGTLREFLTAFNSDTVVHRGTQIANAINTATDRLIGGNQLIETFEEGRGHNVLILFTDGEDHGKDAVGAAKNGRNKGVHVYCVGVGNADRSVPIPLAGENVGYKRDVQGQIVLTTLDESGLREIAEAGNGRYYHADEGIMQLAKDLARLEKKQHKARVDGQLKERFQWFVGLAIILLICELLILSTGKAKLT